MRDFNVRSAVLKFFPTVGTQNSHISASPGPAWDPTHGRCLGFRKGLLPLTLHVWRKEGGAHGEGAGSRPGVLATGPLPRQLPSPSESLGSEEHGKAHMESWLLVLPPTEDSLFPKWLLSRDPPPRFASLSSLCPT